MQSQRENTKARQNQQIEAIKEIANKKALMGATALNLGLNAEEMYQLQKASRERGVYIKVMRNTLAHRALEKTPFASLQSVLKGPVILFFSIHEASAAARLLKEFSKKYEKLVVKNFVFEKVLLQEKDLDRMATLPTREETLARLVSILYTPVQKLSQCLLAPPTQLTRILSFLESR